MLEAPGAMVQKTPGLSTDLFDDRSLAHIC